jgi:hypothetical protein
MLISDNSAPSIAVLLCCHQGARSHRALTTGNLTVTEVWHQTVCFSLYSSKKRCSEPVILRQKLTARHLKALTVPYKGIETLSTCQNGNSYC